MTDNDLLKDAKEFEHCQEYDWCKADAIIEGLLELIEENEIKANHRYLDLQQVCDDQDKLIARLEAAYLEAEAAAQYYETCLLEAEADDVAAFFGWPGRKYQAFSDKDLADGYRKDARESLERIKRGDVND